MNLERSEHQQVNINAQTGTMKTDDRKTQTFISLEYVRIKWREWDSNPCLQLWLVCLLFVWVWVRISFAAIFTDKLQADKSL